MKILRGGRGSGKTYELVRMLKNDPDGILVLPTFPMGRTVQREYGIPDNKIAHLEDPRFHDKLCGHGPINLYIDVVRDELSDELLDRYNIKAIAIDPDLSIKNVDFTLDHQIRIHEWYLEQLKSLRDGS